MSYKIMFATDLHIRVSKPVSRLDQDYLETVCGKLRQICELSKTVDLTILGGDIFDAPNCPNSAVIKVMRILSDCGSFIHTAVGQHDIWGYAESSLQSSALGVLIESGCIRRLEPMNVKGIYIHPVHAYDKLHGIAPENSKLNILVAHKLLTNKNVPSGLSISDFHTINRNNIVLSGDMHEPHDVTIDGRLYINPGAIARQSISDLHRMPQVVIVEVADDFSFTHRYIPLISKHGREIFDVASHQKWKASESDAASFIKDYASSVMSVKAESFKVGSALSDFMSKNGVPDPVQQTVKTYYSNAERAETGDKHE